MHGGLHPRAVGRGRRRGCRGARRGRRPPRRGAAGQHPRRRLPSGADRRRARARLATRRSTRMRDQRADALAQILVRYSTKRPAGRRLRDPVDDRGRAARPGDLRGGPARGRPADHAARRPRAPRRPSTSSPTRSSSSGSRRPRRGRPRTPTCASPSWRTPNTRALSQVDPKRQAIAQKARKPLMETSMKRAAEGSYRWSLTLFPTHAYAAEAGHVARRLRGLLLPRLPRDRRRAAHGLAAPVRRGEAAGGVDGGQGGGPHHRRPAPTSRSAWPGAPSSRASASTTCPTASSSPARSRTR